MVLECIDYTWEHTTENQWSHQWCKLTMDGQIGWQMNKSDGADAEKICLPIESPVDRESSEKERESPKRFSLSFNDYVRSV